MVVDTAAHSTAYAVGYRPEDGSWCQAAGTGLRPDRIVFGIIVLSRAPF